MILEICATSIASALNAEKAGAHRIELCSELAVGGITPSHGFITEVLQRLKIPVFVLIRPRSGDFCYSEAEFNIMKTDIEICKNLGCAGIVSGILKSDNSLDIERTRKLIEISYPLEFTFHRAFDWIPNPFEALDELIKMRANRILTSGQQSSASEGFQLLCKLQTEAKGKLTIMPGGGINPTTISQFSEAGFTEIHSSASVFQKQNFSDQVAMNSPKFLNEKERAVADVSLIRKMIQQFES